MAGLSDSACPPDATSPLSAIVGVRSLVTRLISSPSVVSVRSPPEAATDHVRGQRGRFQHVPCRRAGDPPCRVSFTVTL
jgi:hypothetical protein